MQETWKDVNGYKGFYKVSSWGRIFSFAREGTNGGLLSLIKTPKSYLVVNLYQGSKLTNCRVHRLVARAFIPNPDNKPEINHKNGVKTDNRVDNLEWVTHEENITHATKTGLMPKGENCYKAKLTEEDVLKIIELLKINFLSMKQIARLFNVGPRQINYISQGKSWTHLTGSLVSRGLAKGSNNGAAKLNEEKVLKIKKLLLEGNLTHREIAGQFSIDRAIIGRIKAGTAWKHVSL